jgi:hypothetical protein
MSCSSKRESKSHLFVSLLLVVNSDFRKEETIKKLETETVEEKKRREKLLASLVNHFISND